MRRKNRPRSLRLAAFKRRVSAIRQRKPHRAPRPDRGRMRAFGVTKKRTLLFIPLILAAIVICAFVRAPRMCAMRFRAADPTQVNPLMGWAIDATADPLAVQIDHSLVYATLTWRDFEPQEGVYDFAAFEKKNHLDAWWAAGKRLVLRFVMDVPGAQAHLDIPDWLYARLGNRAGAFYDNAYGRGFSPNYTHLVLMEKHRLALSKLAERYDGHPGVAFVEMGSVGHNGAWVLGNVPSDWGLPPAADLKRWVYNYTASFTRTQVLASAAYQPALVAGLGFYNDQLGNRAATWDWLDDIEFGGYDEQMGAEKRAVPGALLSLPSGARLTRHVNEDALFTTGVNALLSQIAYTHATYVSGVSATNLDKKALEGMSLAQAAMGYKLWVREARYPSQLRAGYRLLVELDLRNDGAQAFSQSWPVELSLLDGGQVVLRQTAQLDLRTILPGETRAYLTLDIPRDLVGTYDLAIAICDPATDQPAVSLAMSGRKAGLRAILGEITLVP
ncbi:MAG: DUF4832 domain-containing protein [Clostridia bacterium]